MQASSPNQLAAFLSEHKKAIFSLVIDIAEEEFVAEGIPRLSARDTSLMLARKLAQRYRHADYRLSYRLGKSGWRDWNKNKAQAHILTALTQITSFEALLEQLDQQQIKVKAIYTTSMLAASAFKSILKSSAALLLMEHRHGLRQVLIVSGLVRFARLAPIQNMDDQSFIEQELVRMLDYLQIGRLVSPEVLTTGALEVHVVTQRPPITLSGISVMERAIEPIWHNLKSLVPRLRAYPESGNPYGVEALYAVPTLRNACKHYYRPRHVIRHWQIFVSKRTFNRASAAVVFVTMLFGLYLQLDIDREREQIRTLAHQTQSLERQYEAMRATFPPLSLPLEDIKNKVKLVESASSRGSDAETLLKLIGEHLDDFPDLRLTRVAWSLSRLQNKNSLNAQLAAGAGAASGGAPTKAGIPGAESEGTVRSLLIEGITSKMTKQESNALVSDLERRLVISCRCEVVATLPFDVSPSGSIVDKGADIGHTPTPPEFKLNLLFPLESYNAK
jgi:hypothetical protein